MKGCEKSFAMKCFFFFDAHAVLFTVRIWGASCYETRRVNGIALILVVTAIAQSFGAQVCLSVVKALI